MMLGRLLGKLKLPIARERPSLVSWNLTAACNLRCPHCYLDAGKRRSDELDTAEALRVVEELADAGVEMLVLTGGEPLLRPDLEELARRASARGILVVLGSNGVLLDEARAHRLAAAGIRGVALSLDATEAARHDAFRGVAGAWAATMRALDACRQAGLETIVQTTLKSDNLGELDELVALARSKGAQAFNAYFLVCTGRAEGLTDLTPEQYETAITALVDAQRGLAGDIMLRAKCAPHAARVASERGVPLAGSSGCIAGRSYVRIGPTGEITPCPYMPVVVGNVRDASVADVWADAPLFATLRARALGGRCGRCEHAEVCGGCRARALAATGDVTAEDPWCRYDPPPDARERIVAVGWTPEALERLERVPGFIRERMRLGLEAHARARGLTMVTGALMSEVRRHAGGHPPSGSRGSDA